MVSQILGIPNESIIDERQYQYLAKNLANEKFWHHYFRRYDLFPFDKLAYDYYRRMVHEAKDLPEQGTILLANHTLSLMASPVRSDIWQFWPWVFPRNYIPGELRELNLENEAFELGLRCFFSAIDPDKRVRQFIQAAKNYEIPSGQSPETESESLLNLFETSKKVCLAPMGAGGAAAIPLLTQGSYVAALLTAGTGAAITLILIGTVSVADYLVYYLLHKRNAIGKSAGEGAV